MKAYDWAVNQQLSQNVTSAEVITNVVSNVQFRDVQLCFVSIMLCMGTDLDRIANVPRGWSAKAWRLLFQAYSTKNDARLVVVMMMVVLVVSSDTNDMVAEVGDAMYVTAIVKRSPNDVSKCSGRSKDSEFVCWYFKRESDSEHPMCRKKQWEHDEGQSKGSRRGDNRGKNQKEFKCKYHKCSELGLGMYFREASAFETSKRGLAETGYVDMASLDLNSLEIGSVLLPERNREIQMGTDSCVAVIVFSRVVADDVTRLRTPGDRQVPRCVWYVNPRMAETCKVLTEVPETSDMSHDVSFPCCNKGTTACANHEGCGMRMELESNRVFDLPV